MRRKSELALVLGLLVVGTAARAEVIVQFNPQPLSVERLPELQYIGFGPTVPSLRPGPGAIGNGDGIAAPELQTAPGLTLQTPFTVAGSIAGKESRPDGSTLFYDVSLDLDGLSQMGAPIMTDNGFIQRLTPGTFSFVSTSGPFGVPQFILLEGTIDNAFIHVDGTLGSVLSANVTYTGGGIYNALAEQLGITAGPPIAGQLSWDLLDLQPTVPTVPPVPALWQGFDAEANGQFSAVIPEPSGLLLTMLGAVPMLSRRRRS